MPSPGPGFVVLYRWRLHSGAEASFVKAWSRVSELYVSERGSLGSRLHRGPDGIWYSYAQWPSAEARQRAFSMEQVDAEAEREMQEAVAEHFPSIELESVADFMLTPLYGGIPPANGHGQAAAGQIRPTASRHPVPIIAPSPVESDRLIVRLVAESDLPSLMEVNSNEEVTALLPYATWLSMSDAEAWLQRMRDIEATGLALQFVVVLKSTGMAIGTCLLFRFDEGSARAELGYVLGRAHWGRGIMQEALEALLGRAFGDMGLRRVEAEVDVRNGASARVLRRLGFTNEGRMRQRWVNKGEARDVEMYGLLRQDWIGHRSMVLQYGPSRSEQTMTDLPPLPEPRLGRYRHYKGGEYEVVGVARHSETLEPLVLYRPLYGGAALWVRPYAMFFESIAVDGLMRPRFAALE